MQRTFQDCQPPHVVVVYMARRRAPSRLTSHQAIEPMGLVCMPGIPTAWFGTVVPPPLVRSLGLAWVGIARPASFDHPTRPSLPSWLRGRG